MPAICAAPPAKPFTIAAMICGTAFTIDTMICGRFLTRETSMAGMKGKDMFGFASLITIQQMIVRSEDDIRKISQELYNLIQTGSRAGGRIITA